MTAELPEGASLGTMQAPLKWVFSHTGKFVGKVAVEVQGGNGFLLIRKGEVLAYWFRSGGVVLRGNAAREYLLSQGEIALTLCRYTGEELSAAEEWCGEHGVHLAGREPAPAPAPPRPRVHAVPASSWSGAGVIMVGWCDAGGLEVLAGERPADLDEHALCSAYGIARDLAGVLGIGEVSDFTLETRSGTFLVTDDKDGVLCLIAAPDVPFGRVKTLLQPR